VRRFGKDLVKDENINWNSFLNNLSAQTDLIEGRHNMTSGLNKLLKSIPLAIGKFI
jgi:hypothetical protein